MRLPRIVAAAALLTGTLASAAPAHAAPVVTCNPVVTGYATSPNGGLVSTTRVVEVVLRVECSMDALQTPPADWINGWSGHAGALVEAVNGGSLFCQEPISNIETPAVATQLVIVVALSCDIPTDSEYYRSDLEVLFGWDLKGPGWSDFGYGSQPLQTI